MFRNGHKVTLQFGDEARGSAHLTRRNISKQFVVVRIRLLIHVHAAVSRCVHTLAGGVIDDVIHTFGDWEDGDLFPVLRVENNHLSAAARRKQALVHLIQGHSHVDLALCYWPARENFFRTTRHTPKLTLFPYTTLHST